MRVIWPVSGTAKGDAGHCHARKPSARICRERRQGAGSGQQVQRGGEQQDEQHRQPERRRSDAGDGEDADDLVGPAVAIQGGHDAEDGAGDDGDDEAEEAELQRDGQCGGDATDTDWFEGPNVPRSPWKKPAMSVAVANDQGIVEAVLDAVGLNWSGDAFSPSAEKAGSIGESDIRKKTRTVTPNTMMGSQSRRLPINRSRLFTRSLLSVGS